MRLFKRGKIWYVEIGRGRCKSLKTGNRLFAQELFKDIQRAEILGKFIEHLPLRKGIKLSEFIHEYQKGSSKSYNTQRLEYESIQKLINFNGDISINKVTPDICKGFKLHLINRNLKATTINIAIRHLRVIFNTATRDRYISESPFRDVKEIPIKDNIPRAMEAEEVKRLLSVIDKQEFKEYIYTVLYTAGRREEIAKIDWNDFKNYNKHWFVKIGAYKTNAKVIPVASPLQDILFYRKKEQGAVFPYYKEHVKEASRHFRHYADSVGLREYKLHDLRHTSSTFMLLAGVPIRVIQYILGHTKVETTEIYTKVAPIHLREGIDVLRY